MFLSRTTRKVVEITEKKIEEIRVLPKKPRIKGTDSEKEVMRVW